MRIAAKQVLRIAAATAAEAGILFAGSTPASDLAPQPVPEVAEGFTVTPLVPLAAPTALAFGPGDGDGPDLYATVLSGASGGGEVVRVALQWTPLGPIATGVSTRASGFSQPLGLAFDGEVLYVSDSHPGAESGRTDGRITRLDPGAATQSEGIVIVDGLPNGRHNTNHLRFRASDGRLYFANGNPNDSGCPPSGCVGGEEDVFPYSGAILSVDVGEVSASPAVLHWKDDAGAPIPPAGIASHPRNADFAAKVAVLAHGFRNVFGIAFSPQDVPYTAMNGADEPPSQDTLDRIAPGADYGFPFCYDAGPPGGVGSEVSKVPNPLFPGADCSPHPTATALLGWHTCTTGLDFPTQGTSAFPPELRSSVFVAECTAFFAQDLAAKLLEDLQSDDPARATHSTSHKVVRVELDENGEAVAVHDFLTGLVLATDVLFGPDGAMYVADVGAVHRVAPLAPGAGAASASAVVPVQAVGLSFVPPALVVPAGTTVEWQSTLFAPHTVTTASSLEQALAGTANDPAGTDGDPDTFRSGSLTFGSTFRHTFQKAGTFWYFCEPHHSMGMVGVVTVVGAGP